MFTVTFIFSFKLTPFYYICFCATVELNGGTDGGYETVGQRII